MQAIGHLLAGFAFAVLLAFAATAQTDLADDLSRWETEASRAEAIIDSEDSSDAVLEELRENITEFRGEFDSAKGLNAARIATLREQLGALGPAPEGDAAAAEDPDIANQRIDLSAQLVSLQAPGQQAETAFLRADGLIDQIDDILRERQNQQLLEVTPSPLNPVHWRPALEDLRKGALALWNENDTAGATNRMANLRAAAPVVLLLGGLGVVLIWRGRRWSRLIVRLSLIHISEPTRP